MTTFLCPYCEAAVEAAPEQLDSVLTCSSCGRPFRTALPAGVIVEDVDGEWLPALTTQQAGEEITLDTVRPATFRRAPLRTLILGALVALGLFAAVYGWLGNSSAAEPSEVATSAPVDTASDADDGIEVTRSSRALLPPWAWLLVSLGALLPLIFTAIATRFETLTITSRRSIWRRGILIRSISEVEHADIRNIQVQQGVSDQILRVGRVSISSAGQNNMEISVRGLPRPDSVVDLVRRCQREAVKPT